MKKLIIMKKIFLLAALLISAAFTFSQDYEDLLVMYADGDFDKLVKTAESYTIKDKSKNDPEPYYWLAKGLFAMSKDAEYTSQDKYKNAYKDAITAIGKLQRKDKDGSIFSLYWEFFSEFKLSLYEVIENEISTGNYSKAYGWVIKVPKVDANDVGSKYLLGVCKYHKGDKSGATAEWKIAEQMLSEISSVADWNEPDFKMLSLGLIQTAECYIDSRKADAAKALMNKGYKWLEDDQSFKAKYDEIVN